MSRYKEYKYAIKKLKEIENSPQQYFLIHYSCESFYKVADGKTPRITSIAIKSIGTGQVESFSMHKIAEQKRISLDSIVARYDDIEKAMLKEYFSFIKENKNMTYIHVNMRDINYGFKAIEHRGKVLGITPFVLHDKQKIDLADLLKKRYGDNYIGHPRMESLCKHNDIRSKGFMNGQDEADAFDNQEYIKLHQSTLAKIEMYTNVLKRAVNGTLKTNAKWHEIYGISIKGIYEYINNKLWLKLLLWLSSAVVSGIIGVYIERVING